LKPKGLCEAQQLKLTLQKYFFALLLGYEVHLVHETEDFG
jgi:hypothetical protein